MALHGPPFHFGGTPIFRRREMTRSLRQSSRRIHILRRGKSTLILSSAASLVAASLLPQAALAASGTWLRAFGGVYDFADSSNWINGNVPGAADEVADFSRFNLQSGDMNVTLSSARTIGGLLVGDIDTFTAVNAI